MAEDLIISAGSKTKKYENIFPQIKALLNAETNKIARLGNFIAALKTQFDWHWVGFYFVVNDELILGPFQGPVACTRIEKGKGVCGKAFADKQTIIVPDVHRFENHIACSSLSNSEIVIPIFNQNEVIAVLDVDSVRFDDFDKIDQGYLEKICSLI